MTGMYLLLRVLRCVLIRIQCQWYHRMPASARSFKGLHIQSRTIWQLMVGDLLHDNLGAGALTQPTGTTRTSLPSMPMVLWERSKLTALPRCRTRRTSESFRSPTGTTVLPMRYNTPSSHHPAPLRPRITFCSTEATVSPSFP